MKAVNLTLVLLIIYGATVMFSEGRIEGTAERCLCQGAKLQKRVKPALVEKLEIFFPSASCSFIDIIVTLKNGRQFCLDPNKKQGRAFLRGQKQNKDTKIPRGKKQKKNKQQN